jgi:DNA polymerase-1
MSVTHYNRIAQIMGEGNWINTEYRVMAEYRRAQTIAIDLETWGGKSREGLSHKKGHIAVISMHAEGLRPVILHYPIGSPGPSQRLMRFLEKKQLVGHNLTAFDIPFLGKYGFRPFSSVGWIDTLIAEQLAMVSGRRDLKKDLETTLHRRLNINIDKSVDHRHWGNEKLSDAQIYYVLNDVTLLLQLWEAQRKAFTENNLWDAWELESGIFPIVANMILQGMPLDVDMLNLYAARNRAAFGTTFDTLMNSIEIDSVNSPKQIKGAFLDAFGYDLTDTKSDTLLRLSGRSDEVGRAAHNIQQARVFKKRGMYDSDWMERFYNNGRVNARYVQLGTDTSRFSSRDPNLQQIPGAMREMFGYDENEGRGLLKCDFSQIEVVVFGIMTHEKQIIEWYKTGKDVHSEVAAALYSKTVEEIDLDKKNGGNLRRTAKAATFAMLFAGGKRSIIGAGRKEGFEITDEEAGKVLRAFFRNFPNAGTYIDAQRLKAEKALRDSYAVPLRLPYGPKRVLFGADVTASRLVNTIVQGTASVGLKWGLLECIKAGIAQHIVAVVHDELVMDVAEEDVSEIQPILEQCMKDGMKKVIGLEPKVESAYGTHWQR